METDTADGERCVRRTADSFLCDVMFPDAHSRRGEEVFSLARSCARDEPPKTGNMRPRGSSEDLEARRLKAARLLQRGMSLSEVARLVGRYPSSVHRWKQALVQSGRKGLNRKQHSGPKPRLSPSQRRDLKKLIRTGVLARRSYWYGLDFVKKIQERYGVTYHPGHMGRLLRSIGLSSDELRGLDA